MSVNLQEQRATQVAQQLEIQDQQLAQQQLRQQLQVSHPSSLIMILNLIVIAQAQQVAQGADQAQEDEQFRQQLQVSHPFPLLIILNLISIQAQQVTQDQAQHQQLSQEQVQHPDFPIQLNNPLPDLDDVPQPPSCSSWLSAVPGSRASS